MSGIDDQPDGFGEFAQMPPGMASVLARHWSQQLVNQRARDDPEFAAERRQSRRQAKAWRRERERIAHEVGRLQVPFLVALLNPHYPSDRRPEEEDVAAVVLKVSRFLLEHDAEFSLISDLLRVGKRLIPE